MFAVKFQDLIHGHIWKLFIFVVPIHSFYTESLNKRNKEFLAPGIAC